MFVRSFVVVVVVVVVVIGERSALSRSSRGFTCSYVIY